jgi:hypothetical protein
MVSLVADLTLWSTLPMPSSKPAGKGVRLPFDTGRLLCLPESGVAAHDAVVRRGIMRPPAHQLGWDDVRR